MFVTIFSIVISTIALLVSIFNMLYQIYKNKTKIDIIVDSSDPVSCCKGMGNRYFIPCQFLNQAGADVCITRITLVNKQGQVFHAHIVPKFRGTSLWRSPDTGEVSEERKFTIAMPINLVAYSGRYGVLRFDFDDYKNFEFEEVVIKTNKKTVKSKELAKVFSNTLFVIKNRNNCT